MHCKYTLVLDHSADWHLLHYWFILVIDVAFSQGLGFLVVGNFSHAHSPATPAALQMQLPGAVDVRNPRANNTICCAFHSSQIILHLPDCRCLLFRSQACRAGRNILGNYLHLNTCISFLTEDINEDIRICSTAANFTSKNSDHVFVDCKERGRNPSTLITQWFNTKHNSTN